LATAAPKRRLEREIVVKTRTEVANIIVEADLEASAMIIIKMLPKKRDVKLNIAFRFRSILLPLIKSRAIKSSGKT